MTLNMEQARFAMVEQQVRPWEVLDVRVLEALSKIKREDFVPFDYRELAFADLALPLEHGETMMKPVVEGRLLEALDIPPTAEVLEIGTGSGFLTACLAWLGRSVVSIDLHTGFIERASARLHQAGIGNVRLETADVMRYTPARPFDIVAVTGAVDTIPAHFRDWMKPGGRMFIVRGRAPAMEAVLLERTGTGWREESLFETELLYLRGAEPVAQFIF